MQFYGLAFAEANICARPIMACVLPVCRPHLTMLRSALCLFLPLTVTMLSFLLYDFFGLKCCFQFSIALLLSTVILLLLLLVAVVAVVVL